MSADQKFDPNDLDPFFWDRHHPYLLSGPGQREALTLLDEFLDKKGEGLVMEPLKRALLQRDLWALFDWASSAFSAVIITFIFATYFSQGIAVDKATGTAQWGWALSASGIAIALLGVRDESCRYARWLSRHMVGCLATG